jgi:putative membrane protein
MIIKGILKFIILSAALLIMPFLVPGISVATTTTAIIAALVIGLIHTFIKPILKLLTLPLNVLTLGLFGFLLNAVLFWVASLFVPGFEVQTYSAGIIGSIIVAVVIWILDKVL